MREEALTAIPCERVLEELKERGELAWAEPKELVRGRFLRTLPEFILRGVFWGGTGRSDD